MHPAAYRYVRQQVAKVQLPAGLVVEIGARNVNGSVRDFFLERRYVGIDAAPGTGVDVVASGASVALAEAPAVVISTETLEHTEEAEAICRNAARMLVPGGVFIVTAAGEGRAPHSAVDGGPIQTGEYYANVTLDDLRRWLSDFEQVHIQLNPADCDIYATAIKARA